MKQVIRFVFQAGMALAMLAGLIAIPLQTVQAATPIGLAVTSVIYDSKVFVSASNLPFAETFVVRMGTSGKQGLDGSVVATFDTDATTPTTRAMMFEIPVSLSEAANIDLRIDGVEGKTSAYVTFANSSTTYNSAAGIGGIPTLSVLSVVASYSVTIQTTNLPADTDFKVRMGETGTQGVGGSVSAGFNSGVGGTQVNTFAITEPLFDSEVIDIRIEADGGYFASSSFKNTSSAVPAAAGVGGLSSLIVGKVIGDSMVTFTARNLPADTSFVVRVGAQGSQGMGGNVVANFDAVAGGMMIVTVEIPTNLYGSAQLDLRVEAPGGYAIYGTFANVTAP